MPYTEQQARKRVLAIVSYHTGVGSNELSNATDLLEDLGVTGDDALELLTDAMERLGIDFSEFQFDRHFTSEGGTLADLGWMALSAPMLILLFAGYERCFGAGFTWWLLVPAVLLMYGWNYFGALVRPSIKKWNRDRMPVTIEDIVRAAVRGRWEINYERINNDHR